jgi:hypothetical protein
MANVSRRMEALTDKAVKLEARKRAAVEDEEVMFGLPACVGGLH